jgi:hypothetical protein
MKCGACGASYTKYGANRFACAGARDRATCTNHLTIRGDDVEHAILRGLKTRLMDPALFEEFAREFMTEVNKQRSAASAAKAGMQSDIERIDRQIKRLVDAILEGADAKPISAKLNELEAEKTRLTNTLRAAPEDQPVLHPNLAAIYRNRSQRFEIPTRAARPSKSSETWSRRCGSCRLLASLHLSSGASWRASWRSRRLLGKAQTHIRTRRCKSRWLRGLEATYTELSSDFSDLALNTQRSRRLVPETRSRLALRAPMYK